MDHDIHDFIYSGSTCNPHTQFFAFFHSSEVFPSMKYNFLKHLWIDSRVVFYLAELCGPFKG